MKMFLLMEHHQIVKILLKNVNINIYYFINVNMVIILYVLLIVNVTCIFKAKYIILVSNYYNFVELKFLYC